MQYYKEIDQGYITVIGTGLNEDEISGAEYNAHPAGWEEVS